MYSIANNAKPAILARTESRAALVASVYGEPGRAADESED